MNIDFIPHSRENATAADGKRIIFQDYIPASNVKITTTENPQGEEYGSQRTRPANSKKRGKKSPGGTK